MELSNWLNIIGLFLDIFGVFLLYKYGLPEDVNRSGIQTIALNITKPEEIKKGKMYDKYSKIGLYLLIFGFVFQILANINICYLLELLSKNFQ